MVRSALIAAFVAILFCSNTALAQENHLAESQTGVLTSRSAFAHGYRHGYEEGYRQGNMDINMSRPAKTKYSQFKGLPLGYSSDFGPRRSFELGFQEGLKPGYSDGYTGRKFRAITALRAIAAGLDHKASAADARNFHFDNGVIAGYMEGFSHALAGNSSAADLDFRAVECTQGHGAGQQEAGVRESYCSGYRRGYALGHADGVVMRPERAQLEASR